MTVLDENIVNRLKYTPTCQHTLRKYKKQILPKVFIYLFFTILFSVFAYEFNIFIEGQSNNIKFQEQASGASADINGLLAILFLIIPIGVCFFFFRLWLYIKDYTDNKLYITEDLYMNYIGSKEGKKLIAQFQDHEDIDLRDFLDHPFTALNKNTPVYIVKTSISKTLLDIVPIDEV
ncbi:hypothetical protein OAK19_05650 [Aureispira]|nr:hypothetical protein [Aureispira sp.]